MRRGGRGSSLRGPWSRHDDAAIASAVYFNRGWTARNCVCIMVLAACSVAISILIWSSRLRPGVHQPSNLGMVFPLYHHHHRHGSDDGMGWRRNRVRRGRGIREEEGHTDVLTNILGGRRINIDDIEHFYIEMKLGNPPVTYNFHVDTGSALSWVYCTTTAVSNIADRVSNSMQPEIFNFSNAGIVTYTRPDLKSKSTGSVPASGTSRKGPHGLFDPEDKSHVSCAGANAGLCRQLQVSSSGRRGCKRSNEYQCLFISRYADDSTYLGYVVNGSFTVAIEDKSERNIFGAFGCVVMKVRRFKELLPLLTDGLIGLGNCKGSLLDQWTTSKAVRQSVLGVCLAKVVEGTTPPTPAAPVGYISMGTDFKEKFDQSNSVWSKLTDPGNMISCAYAANLLYISFDGQNMAIRSALIFDTGSSITYLATSVYGPLLKTLDDYATARGYLRVRDNLQLIAEEQRVCWEPPQQIVDKASPILDFPPLIFTFEGIPAASQRFSFQYLAVQPVNYLVWDANQKKLCVNVLQDAVYALSNLGADTMREHLFVFDNENKRVRWQSDSCELK